MLAHSLLRYSRVYGDRNRRDCGNGFGETSAIIVATEESTESNSVESEWHGMRWLIACYSDAQNGGDGKLLSIADAK